MWPIQFSAEQKDGIASGAKLSAAWGSVALANSAAIANWAQAIASITAATYTTFLCIEFLCKKVIMPLYRRYKAKRHAQHE